MNDTLKKSLCVAMSAATALVPCTSLRADPCGMVWTSTSIRRQAIERIGVQNTYMFHSKGIETIVLRPGYKGRAADFGMLIPFPSPPSVRKVDDDIFPNIEAAAFPPEVVVNLPKMISMGNMLGGPTSPGGAPGTGGPTVSLLREETVGIYQVAVLEAGSATALARWMKAHGYSFPTGMEATCDDYAAAGWCFVAVKTRLERRAAVKATPGGRSMNAIGQVSPDSPFDGYVQAMAFRFRSEAPVLPMRLSTFNAGSSTNRIYALTDRPIKIAKLSSNFVRKQIHGRQLRRNLTEPLPLRVVGGTEAAIPKRWRAGIAKRREPGKHSHHALDLFASDLLAASSNTLLLPQERESKKIEARAKQETEGLDSRARRNLQQEIRERLDTALPGLDRMTLTVLEGELPNDFLAAENLHFDTYVLRTRRKPMKTGSMFAGAPSWLRPQTQGAWLLLTLSSLTIGIYLAARPRRCP